MEGFKYLKGISLTKNYQNQGNLGRKYCLLRLVKHQCVHCNVSKQTKLWKL